MTVLVPFELMKCRSQVRQEKFPNYRRDLRVLLQNEGARGLFKGYSAMFWRDVPGWAVYFWAYEYLKIKAGIAVEAKPSQESY
jgi:hypothetical protein